MHLSAPVAPTPDYIPAPDTPTAHAPLTALVLEHPQRRISALVDMATFSWRAHGLAGRDGRFYPFAHFSTVHAARIVPPGKAPFLLLDIAPWGDPWVFRFSTRALAPMAMVPDPCIPEQTLLLLAATVVRARAQGTPLSVRPQTFESVAAYERTLLPKGAPSQAFMA